jgi:hypothetical protein
MSQKNHLQLDRVIKATLALYVQTSLPVAPILFVVLLGENLASFAKEVRTTEFLAVGSYRCERTRSFATHLMLFGSMKEQSTHKRDFVGKQCVYTKPFCPLLHWY